MLNTRFKVSFRIIVNPTNIFFEIPPCEKKMGFFTEFVTELVNPFIRKQSAHGGISK